MDLYDTAQLTKLINRLNAPSNFLINLLFKERSYSDKEEVFLDKLLKKHNALAPFVMPHVEGKVLRTSGYQTVSLKPAYIKFKHILNPHGMQSRMAGEAIGGSLTAQERLNISRVENLEEHVHLLENRLEWMAAKLLVNGEYILSGDDYPERTINFGRHASLSPAALTGNNRWWTGTAVGSTSDPMGNIQDQMDGIANKSGGVVDLILMGATAWKGFSKHADFEKLIDKTKANGDSRFNVAPQSIIGATKRGNLGPAEIWSYYQSYSENGNETKYIPDNAVVSVATNALLGNVLFGCIMDVTNLFAVEKYSKEIWINTEKSAIATLTQSAPLVYPGRIDATSCMLVA